MPNRLFDFDGPVARFIFRVADLVVVNILTILCLLPVFTFGPALKALAFTTLKMVRNEDGNVVRTYFKNFRLNFGQTVGFGLVCLLLLVIALGDIWVLYVMRGTFPILFVIVGILVVVLVFGILAFAVPMQGRFLNPVSATFRNAFWAALVKFPRTIVMVLSWLILPALDLFVSGNFWPAIVALGLSLPAYLSALLYNPVFEEIEEKITSSSAASDTHQESC